MARVPWTTTVPEYEEDIAAYLANLSPAERAALQNIDDLLRGKVEQRIRPIARPKENVHKLPVDERRDRRVKNKAKRQKRSQRPAGRKAWMPKAKAKQRTRKVRVQ